MFLCEVWTPCRLNTIYCRRFFCYNASIDHMGCSAFTLNTFSIQSLFFLIFTEGNYGWAAAHPGELQWVEAREHRQGNRDISAICNTSHGRWTYHKAQCEVAITHNVVCAMFPVLSAGQTAQRPGSWTETAWLSVMKLPGSQVHPPFCIAVSEQSHWQTHSEPESMLKMRLSTHFSCWKFEGRCHFLSLFWWKRG